MKLQTPVAAGKSSLGISFQDKIIMLGSCFADEVGSRLKDAGFDILVNPFGTLYNPNSILNSLQRLSSGSPFMKGDCMQMGSGADKICSFFHHTSFARNTEEEFLQNANESLCRAHDFFTSANKVIITLGTAWCFRHNDRDLIVSNCLKRNASEFTRERLSVPEIVSCLERAVSGNPDKQFIFTVSPIRHMADGANGNQVSKASLLLSVDQICQKYTGRCEYFPSYEIVMDELRDYRFYAEDMVHLTAQTVGYIFDRFIDFALPEKEKPELERRLKASAQNRHRQILK